RKGYDSYSHFAFGPMVAAAKILGLDETRICDAIGITGYTAPLANLNLWFKGMPSSPIKGAVYWQCKRGIQAVLLAQRGFMGPPDVLDSKEWGFWAGVSDKCDWDIYTYKLGEDYYLEKYLSFKPWSSCRWHHPGIEMLLKLIEKEKIDPMDIEEIVYKVHSTLISWAPFHILMPATDFEAMYSVPYTFATIALGYQAGPGWFAKERRNDPRVKELVKRVRLEEDPEVTRLHDENPEKSVAKLAVKVKEKVYERQTEYARGDPQNPMTQEELETKFSNMAKLIVGDKQAEKIIDIVNHLEELSDLKELTREFARSA
ncbi:MmgE/PrpD family protein, partial [Chloroflexota bacterium]